MPKATVSTDTIRHELKSCEGGFVVVKRLTYGQLLTRREMSMRMEFAEQKGRAAKAEMSMPQLEVTIFEFAHCVVEHNLEDESGRLLDFRKESDLVQLDPRIGDEIGSVLDKLNQFETELGN